MIAPTPLQCDSPKVVTRKIVPKVDMPLGYGLRSPHDDLQAAIVSHAATSDGYLP